MVDPHMKDYRTRVTRRKLLHAVKDLPPESQAAVLRETLAGLQRRKNTAAYPAPGELAAAIDKTIIQTPALRLIDEELAKTVEEGGRLIITMPPQEGKSTRVSIWLPIWALVRNPDTRVVSASYAESLAKRNSRLSRDIVREHGSGSFDDATNLSYPDRLGIRVSDNDASAVSWSVQGHRGSYYATGVGGALTGRSADLLIIDDPLKNQVQADSAREREKVWEWWTGVAQTRLSPGAAVVIIMTRWHEDDLAGRIIAEDSALPKDQRVWRVMNIPAVAEPGVPDALRREPGVVMESARGRSGEEFRRIRAQVGERVWSALYQGQPTPKGGGLFSHDEFDYYRADVARPLTGRIVSVDPAESGHGDEAGLLVMGWDDDGVLYVERDHSGHMTSAVWADRAVRVAVQTNASVLLFEAFTAQQTYHDVLMRAWQQLHRQASLLRRFDNNVQAAAEQWAQEGGQEASTEEFRRTLGILPSIPVRGDAPPFRLVPWRKKGDKVARAAGARQSVATGGLRMIGKQSALEMQAMVWQPGQPSPDRVDAMVNGHDYMQQMLGQQAEVSFPGEW